jgi:hypothetical protein
MQTHYLPRSIAAGLFFGASLLSGTALAQELKIGGPNREVLCPHPATLTLQAAAAPSVNAVDFSSPLPSGQGVRVLNVAGTDQVYRYTFNWKVSDKLCCEISKGKLTIVFKYNNGGNDTVGIVHNNVSVPGQGGYIWTGSTAGLGTAPHTGGPLPPKTVVINLNAASLANATHDNRLSFGMQDDSTIQSATLELSGCCVNHPK